MLEGRDDLGWQNAHRTASSIPLHPIAGRPSQEATGLMFMRIDKFLAALAVHQPYRWTYFSINAFARWFADYAEFIDMAKNILLTHRDLRGVVASYRRVKWEVAIPDAYVSEHMQWRTRCTLDLAYADGPQSAQMVLLSLDQPSKVEVD